MSFEQGQFSVYMTLQKINTTKILLLILKATIVTIVEPLALFVWHGTFGVVP